MFYTSWKLNTTVRPCSCKNSLIIRTVHCIMCCKIRYFYQPPEQDVITLKLGNGQGKSRYPRKHWSGGFGYGSEIDCSWPPLRCHVKSWIVHSQTRNSGMSSAASWMCQSWICQTSRDVNIIPNLYVTHLVCGKKDNNSSQHKSIGHLHSDRIRISQTAIGEYFVSGARVDIVVLSNIQAI